MFAYCANQPTNNIDATGTSYTPVGAGLQLEFDAGCYTLGYEFILYWDETVCDGNGLILCIYSYDGLSIDLSDPNIGSVIATIISNSNSLTTANAADIEAFVGSLKGKFSASISGVLVLGDQDFTSPTSYEGKFDSFNGSIRHVKGSVAFSDTSLAIAIGGTTNGAPSWGASTTYYELKCTVYFNKPTANTTTKQYLRKHRGLVE